MSAVDEHLNLFCFYVLFLKWQKNNNNSQGASKYDKKRL